jgi:hypothetical protein
MVGRVMPRRALIWLLSATPLVLVPLSAATDPAPADVVQLPAAGPAEPSEPTWRAELRGYGHGVGLSQQGARARAEAGHSATQILRFYYPTAQLRDLDTDRRAVRVLVADQPNTVVVEALRDTVLVVRAGTDASRVAARRGWLLRAERAVGTPGRRGVLRAR